MNLSQRFKEIDNHLVGAHSVLNQIAAGGKMPVEAVLRAAIEDLTRARDMLNDFADEPTQN